MGAKHKRTLSIGTEKEGELLTLQLEQPPKEELSPLNQPDMPIVSSEAPQSKLSEPTAENHESYRHHLHNNLFKSIPKR